MDKIVEREIDGTLYKARFRGMAYAFTLRDLIRGGISESRLTDILFTEILATDGIDKDDFPDFEALDRVRAFLLNTAMGNIEPHISKTKLKKQVNDEWACYRLVVNDISPIDYNIVFNQLTPIEIEKLNIALDRVYKEIKRQSKKK